MKITIGESVLSPDQLRAIGCVVVESSYLESFLESIIWKLTNLNESTGKFFTDQLRLKARVELLSDLGKAKIADPKVLEEFTNIITRLKDGAEKRNHIVHGIWGGKYQHDHGVLDLSSDTKAIKRRLRSDALIFSSTKIMETALETSDLYLDLARFVFVYLGLASPRKTD